MENINEKAKMLYIHKGIYVYAGRRIQLGSTKRKIEKICRFSGNGDCRRVFGKVNPRIDTKKCCCQSGRMA